MSRKLGGNWCQFDFRGRKLVSVRFSREEIGVSSIFGGNWCQFDFRRIKEEIGVGSIFGVLNKLTPIILLLGRLGCGACRYDRRRALHRSSYLVAFMEKSSLRLVPHAEDAISIEARRTMLPLTRNRQRHKLPPHLTDRLHVYSRESTTKNFESAPQCSLVIHAAIKSIIQCEFGLDVTAMLCAVTAFGTFFIEPHQEFSYFSVA